MTLACAIALAFVSSTSYPSQVGAQSVRPVNNIPSRGRVRFIPPPLSNHDDPDFSDLGRPRRRKGGGSRGECLVKNKPPLTALVPTTNLGLTVAESPTFWFYVPYTLTPEHSVEFVLKDGNNYVYKTNFPGMGTPPGVVSLRLPSTVPLKADKNYDWYFLIYCDSQNKDKFVFVNGLVRRVERPNLKKQLESATPQKRIILYAAEGIWYDALTSLAERRRAYPQDDKLNDDWAGLLQSVGLEKLAPEPLVPCCSPKKYRSSAVRANFPVKRKQPRDVDVYTSPAREPVERGGGLLPLSPQFLALGKNDS